MPSLAEGYMHGWKIQSNKIPQRYLWTDSKPSLSNGSHLIKYGLIRMRKHLGTDR